VVQRRVVQRRADKAAAGRRAAVKPAPFRYLAAHSRDEALAALHAEGAEAKLLAGGQSLMPLANFRLLRPSVLIDINRIPRLGEIVRTSQGLRIGALARHVAVETSPLVAASFPVLAQAMTQVAHPTIRNRGTFGGSLAHADPAAELPMLALLLEARLAIASVRGERTSGLREFLRGPLATSLAPDEMLIAIDLPAPTPGTGWGFAEVARRHGDFALAAAAATLRAEGGVVAGARIALTGVGDTALLVPAAAAALDGRVPDAAAIDACAAAVRAAVTPMTDLHASAEYRRHLAGVLAARAIAQAWRRAGGAPAP
jgi:CO/xanthine dehydrogenase FAD-binding subunit